MGLEMLALFAACICNDFCLLFGVTLVGKCKLHGVQCWHEILIALKSKCCLLDVIVLAYFMMSFFFF